MLRAAIATKIYSNSLKRSQTS